MGQKPPAFQFYVKDWMTSPTVLRMTHADQGVYVWLLCASWSSENPGTLPLPIEIAARSAGLDPRVVKNFLRKYPGTFKKVGTQLVNEKLSVQWSNYVKMRELKAKAANARHHAGALHVHESASASASASAFAVKDIKPGLGFVVGTHTRKIQEAAAESHVGEGPSDSKNLGGFVVHTCSTCGFSGTKSAVDRGCGKHKPGEKP